MASGWTLFAQTLTLFSLLTWGFINVYSIKLRLEEDLGS